jgi:hypothetical protein
VSSLTQYLTRYLADSIPDPSSVALLRGPPLVSRTPGRPYVRATARTAMGAVAFGSLVATASAQVAEPPVARPVAPAISMRPLTERGVYLTVFRSPSTGLEYRRGRAALHAGFYPTILRADGAKKGNANFVRVGGTYYQRPRGASVFVSPSVVFSLDEAWRNGALTEIGGRLPLGRYVNFRLGAGLLTTVDGEARLNPTVGLDVPLRRSR